MNVIFHCPLSIMFPLDNVRVKAFPYFNYSIELHDHEFYEINIVLSGTGTHRIDGKQMKVHRGSVFFISPGMTHEYFDTNELTVFHIVVSPEIIENNFEEARTAKGFELFTDKSRELFLQLPESKMKLLENDLETINRFGTYGLPESSPLILHTVWKLIYFFSYELSNQLESNRKGKNKYENQILKILEYMHSNFGKKLSVELLGKMVYMSRSTFLRAFEKVCGTTPMKYLDNYRISQAVMLLESTSLSKSEVAQTCGFYDLSHMEKKLKHQ